MTTTKFFANPTAMQRNTNPKSRSRSVAEKRAICFEDDLELLLGDVCRNYGICIYDHVSDLFSAPFQIDANEFAKAVVKSEGLDPEIDLEFVRAIRNDFVERYGADRMTDTEYSACH